MACSDCASSCTGSCNDTCSGTCYDGCSGCGGGCSHCTNCSGGCQGGCGDSCNGCSDCSGCGSCGSSCGSACSGTCYGDCNNGCQTEAKNELITNFPLNDIIKASDFNNIINQINTELERRNKTSSSGANLFTVNIGEKAFNSLRNYIRTDLILMDSNFEAPTENTKLNKNEILSYINEIKLLANTNLKV